jgi:hypothetical protein
MNKIKSDLLLIEINVVCEVPFYFMNIIITNKITMLGMAMTLTFKKNLIADRRT